MNLLDPQLSNRPADVDFDGLVYLLHQSHRLLERDDDALVVGNVCSAAKSGAVEPRYL